MQAIHSFLEKFVLERSESSFSTPFSEMLFLLQRRFESAKVHDDSSRLSNQKISKVLITKVDD
jgi:hypothetical protein